MTFKKVKLLDKVNLFFIHLNKNILITSIAHFQVIGSSPSFAQTQYPVQPVHQAQIHFICQSCDSPKIKWRCEECVWLIFDKCRLEYHAVKGHNIINITIQVKISDVKEYQTKLNFINLLAIAHDNSLWIGKGTKLIYVFNPFYITFSPTECKAWK